MEFKGEKRAKCELELARYTEPSYDNTWLLWGRDGLYPIVLGEFFQCYKMGVAWLPSYFVKSPLVRKAVVHKRGQFCSSQDIWKYLEIFLTITTCCKEGCCWYLMGRDHRCSSMFSNAQDSPHNKELSSPICSSAEVENRDKENRLWWWSGNTENELKESSFKTVRIPVPWYLNKIFNKRLGMEWEVAVSKCKLLYIEWINNKVLLHCTENYIQYPMINHNGKKIF